MHISRKMFLSLLALSLKELAGLPGRNGIMKRKIPSSGEEIPVIGMGTYRTFDTASTDNNIIRLKNVLSHFYESGGRLIDSSPMYGNAEEMIGKTSEGRDFFYATKVWTSGKESGIHQMENSMKKMKRPVMDLMQIHNLQDWQTHLKTLREWKESGRIRYIGITHYVPSAFPQMEKIMKQEKIDFIQIPYSAVTRDAEKSILGTAMNTGTAVMVNRPFEGGSVFREIQKKPLPACAKDLQAASWAQVLLKYILADKSVTCVIPATGNPVHMKENMEAGFGILPDPKQKREILKALVK